MTLVEQEPPAEPSPEESEGADVGDELERPAEERKYPSTIGGVFYLLVLAAGGAGIAIVWTGDWRLGIQLLAVGLGAAALLRLVLPARDAGMLAVRSRLFDVILLGGFGAALFFLAQTIPNQPG